jgi:acetyl-CoA carboxylase biotin carboxyl carrier protein
VEFSIEQLRELVTILNQTDITELTLESGDLRLSIRKSENRVVSSVMPSAPVSISPNPISVIDSPPQNVATQNAAAYTPTVADALPAKKLVDITSPMVGTFYRSPSPDDPAFIEIGDTVKKGGIVCIIEAMKLMNEIEAEISGQVMEIAVANGEPVEYGQTLLWVKAA